MKEVDRSQRREEQKRKEKKRREEKKCETENGRDVVKRLSLASEQRSCFSVMGMGGGGELPSE